MDLMTEHLQNPVPNPTPPRPHGLSWPIIVGLGALGLLWPLSRALDLDGALPWILVIVVILAAWIGVVGFGRVPRPVLTLTLAGVGAGVFQLLAYAILVTPLALLSWYTVGVTTGLGALSGLAAAGIQKALAR
ncbi:hypothetical protein [Microbacterium karelineae]|uniref:hypothetical protein n=1 Tax=Microbacterium karelineae TaxID=2654283 RepID=UPI0012E9AC27|nr:hypothetical protein [Microbacterium karelineae]